MINFHYLLFSKYFLPNSGNRSSPNDGPKTANIGCLNIHEGHVTVNIRRLNIHGRHLIANIGRLSIHGGHVTANNSTNNNVMFFFVSYLKIVYSNKYQSLITMPWTREENIFCITTYLERKSFKTVLGKFCRKFNFDNYPQKSQIYH